MRGKSQLLVCGAPISTYLGWEIVLPTAFHPVNFNMRIAMRRSKGVIIGVENTVVLRIVIHSHCSIMSIAVLPESR